MGTLAGGVRNDPIQADRGERQTKQTQKTEQRGGGAREKQRNADSVFQGFELHRGHLVFEFADTLP